MESGKCRQSMPKLRGGQWASEDCVQKVGEMLSRAIVHQEDLLGLLTSNSHSSESVSGVDIPRTGHVITPGTISPPVLRALKVRLENSMDWCHLALCRLREIVLHTPSPSSTQHSMLGSSGGTAVAGRFLSSYSKLDAKLVNPSPRLNVPAPLRPLRVLLRKELPLSPHQGRASAWSPGNFLIHDPSPHLPPPAAPPGEEDSSSQEPQAAMAHQQAQNFARLPPQMDSDWPRLLPEINAVASFNGGEPTNFETHAVTAEADRSCINQAPPTRGNRSRNSSAAKCDVRKLSGGEAKLEVVFQKLNDGKKGIPEDGHRGWKKYGNKSIQNTNHCRGYYKCSVKDCRAKKMVQPTDKDPTLFEVTYVGKHTCSSTGHRRARSTRTANPAQIEIQEAQRQFVDDPPSSQVHSAKSTVTKLDGEQACGGHSGLSTREGKKHGAAGEGMDDSILTGSGVRETGCKRRRPNEEEDEEALDNYSYLNNNMTTSTTTAAATTTRASEEHVVVQVAGDAMDTYLHQISSHHHQAVYSFQEPLLWHEFDMDTDLSSGHKTSVSVESVSMTQA